MEWKRLPQRYPLPEPCGAQASRVRDLLRRRNFLKHLHRVEDCDVIVCWIHNWPDCPLDVVELRSAMMDGEK